MRVQINIGVNADVVTFIDKLSKNTGHRSTKVAEFILLHGVEYVKSAIENDPGYNIAGGEKNEN